MLENIIENIETFSEPVIAIIEITTIKNERKRRKKWAQLNKNIRFTKKYIFNNFIIWKKWTLKEIMFVGTLIYGPERQMQQLIEEELKTEKYFSEKNVKYDGGEIDMLVLAEKSVYDRFTEEFKKKYIQA